MNRTCWIAAILVMSVTTQSRSADSSDPNSLSQKLDQIAEQGCQTAGITAFEPCTDVEFLRRVWLDLAGRTPPLKDATAVVSGKRLDRRDLVEKLLKSPEFGRHWGRSWAEYLTGRRPFETEGYDGRRMVQFLTESFSANQSYHELVTELILGDGTSDVSGAVNFLLRYNAEPIPLAGAVSQKFLGLSLHCAECHDHPHAQWKQKDFLGLAAHFARLRKMTPVNPEEGETFFVVIERPRGEFMVTDKRAALDEEGNQPKRTVFPQLPGSSRSNATQQRRSALVEWLTKPSNPYLSRHFVNVIWERLLGGKLVSSLDQWPPTTETADTAILNLLADDFASHGWNVHRLIQTILLSETYQRASHQSTLPASPADPLRVELEIAHWSRARIRPLSADQLHLSVGQAFGYHHDENDHRLAESTGEEFAEDIPVDNLSATSFTLGRSLALYNSDYIRAVVELAADATVRLYGPAAGAEHIDRIFLSLLARRPTTEELEFFQDLGGEEDPREGLQDIVWVLLNSIEFVTNH